MKRAERAAAGPGIALDSRPLDADFVLAEPTTTQELDRTLGSLGFRRRRDRYVHSRLPFFVEFPRGPLGIGEDSSRFSHGRQAYERLGQPDSAAAFRDFTRPDADVRHLLDEARNAVRGARGMAGGEQALRR